MKTARGIPTAATATRFVSSFAMLSDWGYATETALPLLVFLDGRNQVIAAEVGPERGRDVQIGVSEVPEQKVADALPTRCANEEIGTGHIRGVELGREACFIDLIDAELAAAN